MPRKKTNAKPASTKAVKAKPEAAAKVAKATKPEKASRIVHALPSTYAGPSAVTTARKSRTAIPIGTFGTLPEAPLTARDRAAIVAINSTFGDKEFQRGNLDAGVLRRLGERNVITHVRGDDVSETTVFQLTSKGAEAAAESAA